MSRGVFAEGSRLNWWLVRGGATTFVLFIVAGVFAANDWFPETDPMSGQKYGWFGRGVSSPHVSKGSAGPANPSAAPQLSKEYIYAGSRMLAVEDANATAAPPADIAVWRPSSGDWYVMGQTGSAQTTYGWGTAGDKPVPGDFDGDGKTDFAIWRPSNGYWWVFYSATSTYDSFQWGASGDTPIAADFDGDGKSDLGIARRDLTNHEMDWYVDQSGGGGYLVETWGLDNDKPAAADYDGDGKADLATYRSSNDEVYWIRSSDSAQAYIDLGYDGDVVVSSDYDGDGKADPAVFNSSTAQWHILPSTTSQTSPTVQTFTWGTSGDKPVQNDYDGDGKTDLAVWTPLTTNSVWTIKRSSNGTTRTEYWGATNDIPVPAYYRR